MAYLQLNSVALQSPQQRLNDLFGWMGGLVSTYKLTQVDLGNLAHGSRAGDGASLFWIRNKDSSLSAWQRVTVQGKQRDLKVGTLLDQIPSIRDIKRIRAAGISMRLGAGSQDFVKRGDGETSVGALTAGTPLADAWAVFESVIAAPGSTWSAHTLKKSSERMTNHIAPTVLWRMPVGDITTQDLIGVLQPILSNKADTEKKVRMILSKVFTWLLGMRVVTSNPVVGISSVYRTLLKPAPKKKQPAITDLTELRRIYRAIGQSSGSHMTRMCLQLQALTALRSSEVAGAQWSEIDISAGRWVVPRSRMKMSEDREGDHVITLTPAMADVLQAMPRPKGQRFVFASSAKSGHISIEALSKHIRRHQRGIVRRPNALHAAIGCFAARLSTARFGASYTACRC